MQLVAYLYILLSALKDYLQKNYSIYFVDTIANGVTNRINRRSLEYSSREGKCVKIYQKDNYKRHYEKIIKLGILHYYIAIIKINIMKLYYSQILSLSFREAFQKVCSKLGLKSY